MEFNVDPSGKSHNTRTAFATPPNDPDPETVANVVATGITLSDNPCDSLAKDPDAFRVPEVRVRKFLARNIDWICPIETDDTGTFPTARTHNPMDFLPIGDLPEIIVLDIHC